MTEIVIIRATKDIAETLRTNSEYLRESFSHIMKQIAFSVSEIITGGCLRSFETSTIKTFHGNSSRGTIRSETISGYRESFKIWKMLSVSPCKVFMFLRYWHFCCDFLLMKENSFIRKLGKIPKFMKSHLLPDISRSKGSQTKNFVG